MVNLVAVSKHKEKFDNRLDVAQRTIDGKNIHFKEKGGTLWETRAGKRIKTKLKNRKPTNRKKRTRRNSQSTFFARSGGLRLGEVHHFLCAQFLK